MSTWKAFHAVIPYDTNWKQEGRIILSYVTLRSAIPPTRGAQVNLSTWWILHLSTANLKKWLPFCFVFIHLNRGDFFLFTQFLLHHSASLSKAAIWRVTALIHRGRTNSRRWQSGHEAGGGQGGRFPEQTPLDGRRRRPRRTPTASLSAGSPCRPI